MCNIYNAHPDFPDIFCKKKKLHQNKVSSLQYSGKQSVAKWFRAMGLYSGGPRFKASTLPLVGFVSQ